jgi:pSer/pThr/pTyr-binding forkhead associated (FHA) protein
MEDCQQAGEASGFSLQGPHAPPRPGAGAPTTFVPLRLVLRPGGTTVELTRPDMLIGRHSDADVRLALPDISRRHCRMVYASDRWQVFDLNSLNGVFVNGDRVQQATLDEGDTLRIGGLTFAVHMGNPRPGDVPARDVVTRPHLLKELSGDRPNPDSRPPKRKAS